MPESQLSFSQKEQLHDALSAIPILAQVEGRDHCVSRIKDRLGAATVVHRHDDLRHDLWLLISACEMDPRGLRALHEVVQDLHGDLPLLQDLVPAVANQVAVTARPSAGRLARYQREILLDLMAGTPMIALREGFRGVFNREAPEITDLGQLLDYAESNAQPDDLVPLLLRYVDAMAHAVDGEAGIAMHRWIDAVGTGAQLSQHWIRELCLINPKPALSGTIAAIIPTEPQPLREDEGAVNRLTLPAGAVALMPVLTPPVEPALAERRIRGTVPMRNPDFTGRERLLTQLRSALDARSKVAVLPQAMYGQGGVGKTQLCAEYVYRYGNDYQLVWWISAEQPGLVRSSLTELAKRMDLPVSDDIQQTVNTVLGTLSEGGLRWLIVYDNAGRPDDVLPLIPSAGGHVIVTSRHPSWAGSRIGGAIEVNVFDRQESVELLRKILSGLSTHEAELLADRLGDLPLALEQAAKWCGASGMEPDEFLSLLEDNAGVLLDEGKPADYPRSLFALVKLAVDGLAEQSPAASQMLELFAFLGSEPLHWAVFEWGTIADQTSELAKAQRNPIALRKAIRDLRDYGVARVDPAAKTIEVHRLVQRLLRDFMSEERHAQCRADVQHLLASATPTDRMTEAEWPIFAAIAAHVTAADLVGADHTWIRSTIVNHMRYLFAVGDYEASRDLGKAAIASWSRPESEGGLPVNHELTLKAQWRLASALRAMGDAEEARTLIDDTVARMTETLGADHETTMLATNTKGVIYRLAGRYQEALALDESNYAHLKQTLGDDDEYTLESQNSVAINLRIVGDFQRALEMDSELVSARESRYGGNHLRTARALSNLARDLYGIGRYREALDIQTPALEVLIEGLGQYHNDVMLAARTMAIALRKLGRYDEARRQSDANILAYRTRFGPSHHNTLAAQMSHAQCLRVLGQTTEAFEFASEAEREYRRTLGSEHPLTLTCSVNLGIMLRAVGDDRRALSLDRETLEELTRAVGELHPYTLCAASSVVTDLVMHHRLSEANELSQRTLVQSRNVRGHDHPYTLAVSINAAFDLMETDQAAAGHALYDRSIKALRLTLGADHPEVVDFGRGKRAEFDIEPPPI